MPELFGKPYVEVITQGASNSTDEREQEMVHSVLPAKGAKLAQALLPFPQNRSAEPMQTASRQKALAKLKVYSQ